VTDRQPTTWSAEALAAVVDHTLLTPEATRAQVEDAAAVAVERGCASVCVAPEHVAHVRHVVGDRIPVCTVVGFPHGANVPVVKAHEAASAQAHGASELDLVVALGPIADGDLAHVAHEVAVVREAVPGAVLKVIVESALWPAAVLRGVTEAAIDGGADLVKTSTGFHPAGGATPAAVSEMARAAAGRAGVKASGGLRTLAACLAVLDAGATRLGLSATLDVLAECSGEPGGR
jgi:deoxyribose-phosphate aldolase